MWCYHSNFTAWGGWSVSHNNFGYRCMCVTVWTDLCASVCPAVFRTVGSRLWDGLQGHFSSSLGSFLSPLLQYHFLLRQQKAILDNNDLPLTKTHRQTAQSQLCSGLWFHTELARYTWAHIQIRHNDFFLRHVNNQTNLIISGGKQDETYSWG